MEDILKTPMLILDIVHDAVAQAMREHRGPKRAEEIVREQINHIDRAQGAVTTLGERFALSRAVYVAWHHQEDWAGWD